MCGRFGDSEDPEEIARYFEALAFAKANRWKPTWNAAPTQSLPIVVNEGGQRTLTLMRWGWQRPFGVSGWLPPNVRGEEACRKRTFSAAFKSRRCIIPATCFYEWQESTGQPYAFMREDRKLFGIAGLWEPLEDPGSMAFLLVTSEANEVVAPIHHRMACIIPKNMEDTWLDPESPLGQVQVLIKPYQANMLAIPVGTRVNSVTNDGPDLVNYEVIPTQTRFL